MSAHLTPVAFSPFAVLVEAFALALTLHRGPVREVFLSCSISVFRCSGFERPCTTVLSGFALAPTSEISVWRVYHSIWKSVESCTHDQVRLRLGGPLPNLSTRNLQFHVSTWSSRLLFKSRSETFCFYSRHTAIFFYY